MVALATACLSILLTILILKNKYESSKVTWPRHADGSCDYDGSKKTAAVQTAKPTSSTNVIKNKTTLVNENLLEFADFSHT